MVRPRKCRRIDTPPEVTYFKPRGVPLQALNEAYLSLDGFEAIRLADHESLSHEEAAQRMHVSRQTFGRILSSARATVAKALVEGLALCIQEADPNVRFGDTAPADKQAANEEPSNHKEQSNMETIAVTCEGPTLDDQVDPRFGRAAGFIVVDPQTMQFEFLSNGEAQARSQGAGIQAAEMVARKGVKAVLTGYVGPKAFQTLAAAGIRIAQDLENLTVREAVERYKKGAVSWAQMDDAKGLR